MLEPLSFFYRTVGGMLRRGVRPSAVCLLPALDTLPGQGAGPHPEILETRAATLSRFVSGQTSVRRGADRRHAVGFAAPEFYEGLSLSLERDQEISLEEVVAHLTRAGYVRTELVEMPGQFACAAGFSMCFLRKRSAGAHRAAGRHGGVAARIRSRDAALDRPGESRDSAAADGVSIAYSTLAKMEPAYRAMDAEEMQKALLCLTALTASSNCATTPW